MNRVLRHKVLFLVSVDKTLMTPELPVSAFSHTWFSPSKLVFKTDLAFAFNISQSLAVSEVNADSSVKLRSKSKADTLIADSIIVANRAVSENLKEFDFTEGSLIVTEIETLILSDARYLIRAFGFDLDTLLP